MNAKLKNNPITELLIEGFKSIEHCSLELSNVNVLIGANGAGKSNFIGFFRLVSNMANGNLQSFVSKSGGPDTLLHFGRKQTEVLKAEIHFGEKAYVFALEPTYHNKMMYRKETTIVRKERNDMFRFGDSSSGGLESNHAIRTMPYNGEMHLWRVYHFHDTSDSAKVKQVHRINDNEFLREDGSNLAAFLYRLQKNHEKQYRRILKTVQMVAPFFGDFHLRPTPDNPERIELEWTEKAQDMPFKASELSDGTLRFILLCVLLLQPETFKPPLIIIDEPELGLHPYANSVLASLISSAGQTHQVLISTQSVELVNHFEPKDIIVVDKLGGASTFNHLDLEYLKDWLQDYSLGELWQKNLLGGRPQK